MEEWKLEPARDLHLSYRERLRSLERENWLLDSALHHLWWTAIRGYLRLFHRVRVIGAERLPQESPFVMVANHSSHLDALTLTALLPWRSRERTYPLAAGDTFFETTAIAAFAANFLNALPLWRKNCDPRDIQFLRRRLVEDPCAYILFPEGTRSRTGEMAGFKRGIGMLVAGTSVPVVPCRLAGTFEALPSHRVLPRPVRVTLTVGDPLLFATVNNDKEGWTTVAAKAEAAVQRLALEGRSVSPCPGE